MQTNGNKALSIGGTFSREITAHLAWLNVGSFDRENEKEQGSPKLNYTFVKIAFQSKKYFFNECFVKKNAPPVFHRVVGKKSIAKYWRVIRLMKVDRSILSPANRDRL